MALTLGLSGLWCCFTLDLSAMHDTPLSVIKRIAPVHGASVVPKN
jgi:hypothetical protein